MVNRRLSLRSALLLIIAVAILLRLGVAFYYGDWIPVRQDDESYSTLATRVAEGYGFTFDRPWYPFTPADTPTAHWSFGYTIFLAGVYAAAGVRPLYGRLAGAFLGGILLPWLAYRLARRILPEQPQVALLTAAFTAFYTYFVLFAARLMTETFFISGLLWSLERALALDNCWQAKRRPSAGLILSFGLSLGTTALFRQSILPWYLVLFAWLLWRGWRNGAGRSAFTGLFASGLLLLAILAPFTWRNYQAYGSFMLLNSNSGYAMYSGQHPMHGTDFQAFDAAPLPSDIPAGLNEAELDRLLLQRGFAFIQAEPERYLRLSLSRLVDYFKFWPSADTSLLFNIGRLSSFALFLPFMIYGLFRSLRDWRRFALLYLFMLFYSVLHLLTWAMIRYRLPVDAVLLLFAAVGIDHLFRRWNRPLERWLAVPAGSAA